MRKLNNYMNFDFARFQDGKTFVIQNARFNDKKDCVTISVVITEDQSNENLFEKFYVHCVNDTDEKLVDNYPVGSKIVFKKIGKCTPWGDYNSNLSVEAIVEVP
ncbi:MAG: hypothetical protein IKE52_03435 [Mogibacterium sp.]|nr:hypothetical protein [Mogibacterium sp.]